MKLRPYQEEALQAIRTSLEKGVRKQLVVLPTGGGKTIVFAQLPKMFHGNMLVLAHREELLAQAKEKILWANPHLKVEIEQGQNVADIDADVVVASTATLGRSNSARIGKFPSNHFATVVVDEAHHAAAPSYKRILEHFTPQLQLGVTATPQRGDKIRLTDVFDEIVYFKTIEELIRDNYLSNLAGYRIMTETDISKVTTRSGDWAEGELSEAVNTPQRNNLAVKAYRDKADEKKTVVFCVDVQHAEDMAKTFNYAGIPTGVITGAMKQDDRQQTLEDFRSGKLQALANCFDEQTEILTQRGWLYRKDVRTGDQTASINLKTNEFEWTPVTDIVERDRGPKERMVHIKNQTLDIRVTEGHRIVQRTKGAKQWRVVEASDLVEKKSSYILPLAAEEQTPSVEISSTELQLLGLYISDGYIDKHGNLEITQKEDSEVNEEIQRVLDSLSYEYTYTTEEQTTNKGTGIYRKWYVPHRNFKNAHFVAMTLDKNLSSRRFDMLTKEQFENFLYGLWLGDGNRAASANRENPAYEIFSVNQIFLDRLQALAVTRGMATNVSYHPNGDNYKLLGCIRIRDRDEVITNNAHIATSGGNPAQFEDDWKPERVWCVSNKNGTVFIRRNGKAAITGQCMVLTEGFDEPSIECIILARPTQSQLLYTQIVGRGTRLHPGKDRCIIIDLADTTQSKKPIGLPTLMGLPPDFDSEGEDITAVKEKFKELEESAPAEAARAKSLKEITAAWERIDLFMPPPPNEALLEYTTLIWMETGPNRYVLNLTTSSERLHIEEDALGRHVVSLDDHKERRVLGICETMEEAFRRSDRWIQNNRKDQMQLLDNTAQWRVDAPSEKQIKWLKKFGVPITKDLTKGQASIMLDKLFQEKPKPKRSAAQEYMIRKKQGRW